MDVRARTHLCDTRTVRINTPLQIVPPYSSEFLFDVQIKKWWTEKNAVCIGDFTPPLLYPTINRFQHPWNSCICLLVVGTGVGYDDGYDG